MSKQLRQFHSKLFERISLITEDQLNKRNQKKYNDMVDNVSRLITKEDFQLVIENEDLNSKGIKVNRIFRRPKTCILNGLVDRKTGRPKARNVSKDRTFDPQLQNGDPNIPTFLRLEIRRKKHNFLKKFDSLPAKIPEGRMTNQDAYVLNYGQESY